MSDKELITALKNQIKDLTEEKTDAVKLASDKDSKIKQLLIQLENAKDEKIRALAKLENIRRRMQKEKEDNSKYGASDISRDLFEILDNLDRAIQAAPKILDNKDEIESKYL